MSDQLEIALPEFQFRLFNGGWKIHHILEDSEFKAKEWMGIRIFNKDGDGSYSVASNGTYYKTQDIEIKGGTSNDLWYFRIFIDGKMMYEKRRFSNIGQAFITELAKNDGLTPYEFHNVRFDLHAKDVKYFSGKIIHFTDFKYNV